MADAYTAVIDIAYAKNRTLGDGMERTELDCIDGVQHVLKCIPFKLRTQPSLKMMKSMKPIQPMSGIFLLSPKYVPKLRKKHKCLIRKPKEPKFIPYEPYKGAVDPIIRKKTKPIPINYENVTKNNVEIYKLVTQMSEMRVAELNKCKDAGSSDGISKIQWEREKVGYETDLKNLRESNILLENQLKLQTQVNSELKTLLVAAVGEDLESRVQHLTADKLQLARALLKSADHLTSHQEQTEWLSGQCEVWRSKFLASSLMVEELARWKSALIGRIKDLQSILKDILDDHVRIQNASLKLNCNIRTSVMNMDQKIYNFKVLPLKSADTKELSNNNLLLSQFMVNYFGDDKESVGKLFEDYMKLPQQTITERAASKLLLNPVSISTKQDMICNALMGAAINLGGDQIYLTHPSSQATCCAHCTGEIKNI